jgi:hypothetical protein
MRAAILGRRYFPQFWEGGISAILGRRYFAILGRRYLLAVYGRGVRWVRVIREWV